MNPKSEKTSHTQPLVLSIAVIAISILVLTVWYTLSTSDTNASLIELQPIPNVYQQPQQKIAEPTEPNVSNSKLAGDKTETSLHNPNQPQTRSQTTQTTPKPQPKPNINTQIQTPTQPDPLKDNTKEVSPTDAASPSQQREEKQEEQKQDTEQNVQQTQKIEIATLINETRSTELKYLLYGDCNKSRWGVMMRYYDSWVYRIGEIKKDWIVKKIYIDEYSHQTWDKFWDDALLNDKKFSFVKNPQTSKIQWILNIRCKDHKWHTTAVQYYSKKNKQISNTDSSKIDAHTKGNIEKNNMLAVKSFNSPQKESDKDTTIIKRLFTSVLLWLSNYHIGEYEYSYVTSLGGVQNSKNSNTIQQEHQRGIPIYNSWMNPLSMDTAELYYASDYHFTSLKTGKPLCLGESGEVFNEFTHDSSWNLRQSILGSKLVESTKYLNVQSDYYSNHPKFGNLKENILNIDHSWFDQFNDINHALYVENGIDNEAIELFKQYSIQFQELNDYKYRYYESNTNVSNVFKDYNIIDYILYAMNYVPIDKCRGEDVRFVRSYEFPRSGCVLLHFLQSSSQSDMLKSDAYWPELQKFIDLRDYARLEIKEPDFKLLDQHVEELFHNKTHFCAFTVKSVFMRGFYNSDALIRHAFFKLLALKYKHCSAIGHFHDSLTPKTENCPAKKYTPYGLPLCQNKYKFTISMENSMTHGYITEKLYSALFGGSLPIYFGSVDIGKYVNLDRIIVCNVSERTVNRMRFVFVNYGRQGFDSISDDNMIDWALKLTKEELMPCVQQVIDVDQNDTLYKWKLKQPAYPKNEFENTVYDQSSVANAIIDVLQALESPLF